MRKLAKILAVLAFCTTGTTFAQTAPAKCTPFSIPIQSSLTECGPGMTGSKFKTKSKACPGGEVRESIEFDMSGCKAATTSSNGAMTQEARCRLTPGGCANAPIAANCPAGRKWSLEGTGVAHCVDVDPLCPWGTTLQHDANGNPSCIQNSCPSNQQLQSDGKACGCPAGLVLDGATCVAPTPTCSEGSLVTATETCPFGGTKYLLETTTCPDGAFGAPHTATAWDDSKCTAPPPITCTGSTFSESAACSPGSSGTQTRSVTISCPTGQYGSPFTNYGNWNTSDCRATCTPTSSTYATSCGTGFTGTKYVTTNYTCPSGSSQSENTSNCGCANGAIDYPFCTPPPPAQTCPQGEQWNGTSCSLIPGWCPNVAATAVGVECPLGGWGPGNGFGGHGELIAGPEGTIRSINMTSYGSFMGCQQGQGQMVCRGGIWRGGMADVPYVKK